MRNRTLLACGPLVLEDCVDIIHFAQPLKEGDEVQQLGVGHVIEPRGHRHCVIGVEDVGGRGVVHDDDLVQVATQATQVFDVITSVEDTGLPEEAGAESTPLVQEVGDGVCILG